MHIIFFFLQVHLFVALCNWDNTLIGTYFENLCLLIIALSLIRLAFDTQFCLHRSLNFPNRRLELFGRFLARRVLAMLSKSSPPSTSPPGVGLLLSLETGSSTRFTTDFWADPIGRRPSASLLESSPEAAATPWFEASSTGRASPRSRTLVSCRSVSASRGQTSPPSTSSS